MATFSVTARNAAVDAITALLDAGSSRASVVIRTSVPATIYNSFPRGIEPQWSAAASGVASLIGTNLTSATATGTGIADRWSMQANGPGVVVFTGDPASVGLVGSGAEIELTNTDIRTGQAIIWSSFDIEML